MAVNWGLAGNGFNALEALQSFGQAQQQGLIQQQRQMQAEQQQRSMQARQQAGGALAQGDYRGATQAAYQAGDIDLAKHIEGLHQDQQKQLGEQADVLGKVAAGLRQLPAEQRGQALQQYAPALMQRGISQQDLAHAAQDLSDGALDGYINSARSITDTLASGRVKYMAIPQGGYLQGFDAMTGAPIGDTSPPPTAPSQAAPTQQGGGDLEVMAQQAIAAGADPAAVRARLAQMKGGAPSQGGATFP